MVITQSVTDARAGAADLAAVRAAREATIRALVAEQVQAMLDKGHTIRDRKAFEASWRERIVADAKARPGFLRAAARRLGLPQLAAIEAADAAAAAEKRKRAARASGLRFCHGPGYCDALTPPSADGVCGWCGRPYLEEE